MDLLKLTLNGLIGKTFTKDKEPTGKEAPWSIPQSELLSEEATQFDQAEDEERTMFSNLNPHTPRQFKDMRSDDCVEGYYHLLGKLTRGSERDSIVDDDLINCLSYEPLLKAQWEKLANKLGMSKKAIKELNAGCKSVREKTFATLKGWKQQNGTKATLENLVNNSTSMLL